MNKYVQYFQPGELNYVQNLLNSVAGWKFSTNLRHRNLDQRLLRQIDKAISSGDVTCISDQNPSKQLRINREYAGAEFVTTVVLSPLDSHVVTAWNNPVGFQKGRPPIDTTDIIRYVQERFLGKSLLERPLAS